MLTSFPYLYNYYIIINITNQQQNYYIYVTNVKVLCKPEGTLEPYGTAGLRVYYRIITIMLQNYYKSITIILHVNTLCKLESPLIRKPYGGAGLQVLLQLCYNCITIMLLVNTLCKPGRPPNPQSLRNSGFRDLT